jgi:hypothetical protein
VDSKNNNIVRALPFAKEYEGIWGAMGNRTTCNVAGFFLQIGGIGAFYNAALSHYFFMVLRYRMSEREIAQKHEPIIHAVSLGFPIATALAALFQDLYGPSGMSIGLLFIKSAC